MQKEKLITKTEEIWLRDDGIVHCEVLAGYLDLEGAEKYVEAIKKIGKGQKMRVFLDLRKGKGAAQDARNYLADEGAPYHSGMAMLIGSAFTRMLGNFFIGFSQPTFPTKLFNTKEKAIEWLHSLKGS